MLKITICPSCGSKKIKKVQRNWSGQFQGQSYTIPGLEYYECSVCNENVYDRQAMRKIEEHSPAFTSKHVRKVHPTAIA